MTADAAPRTTLITGGSSGIGKAAAIALAGDGWQVLLTSRDEDRGQAAVEQVREASDGGDVKAVSLDLARFESVRSCAAEVLARCKSLDVLINNAGLTTSERRLTEDGLEQMMQVNHFGHFLLTSLLLPRLLQANDARVVNVTSRAYTRARELPFDDINLERRWNASYPYTASKLCNVLFAVGLHARYGELGLTTLALYPGGARTNLASNVHGLASIPWKLFQLFMPPPDEAGRSLAFAAGAEEARNHAGDLLFRSEVKSPGKLVTPEAAEELWTISNKLTGAEWPAS